MLRSAALDMPVGTRMHVVRPFYASCFIELDFYFFHFLRGDKTQIRYETSK